MRRIYASTRCHVDEAQMSCKLRAWKSTKYPRPLTFFPFCRKTRNGCSLFSYHHQLIMDPTSGCTTETKLAVKHGFVVDDPSLPFRTVNCWGLSLQQCLIAKYSTNYIQTIDDIPSPPTQTTLSQAPVSMGGGKGSVPLEEHNFSSWDVIFTFLMDTLPRHFYINLLFHLPCIYLSPFTALFDGLSLAEMKLLLFCGSHACNPWFPATPNLYLVLGVISNSYDRYGKPAGVCSISKLNSVSGTSRSTSTGFLEYVCQVIHAYDMVCMVCSVVLTAIGQQI